MKANTEQAWEMTIGELTQMAQQNPSPSLFRKLADCYQQLEEFEEASILLDMARQSLHETEHHHFCPH